MWWGEAVRQDGVGRNLSGPRPVSAPDSLPYFVDNKFYSRDNKNGEVVMGRTKEVREDVGDSDS